MECMNPKELLRRSLRQKVAGLSPEYFRKAGEKMAERLFALPEWTAAPALLAFMSLPAEPDTAGIISAAREAGKTVLLPRCLPGGRMAALPFTDASDLEKNRYGIPEPRLPDDGEAKAFCPPLILVPCMAATRTGLRLGHGAGYYDRYLSKTSAFTLCLCPDIFLMEEIPTDPWDVRMDAVITETNIYRRWKNPE